jgi:hypothetical protein
VVSCLQNADSAKASRKQFLDYVGDRLPLSVRSLSVRHGLGSASASPCAGGHDWGSHWIAVLHRLQGSNALDRGSRPYKRRYTHGLLKRPGVI